MPIIDAHVHAIDCYVPLAPFEGTGRWDRLLHLMDAAGVERAIVLDLAAVGIGGGTPHLDFCRQWKGSAASMEIITGGGVRGVDDLVELRDAGVDGVLVASALHDGRLDRDAIARVSG